MEPKPVKIYSSSDSPRLNYIADLIFREILGLSWEIVTDRRKIGKCPVINYSTEEIRGSFRITPAPILFETGVRTQEIKIEEWNGLPVFFRCTPDSGIPFDIFGASFYMVTRYEEYLDFVPDEFGGFRAADSLAFRHGFLGQPVVDLWVKELAKALVRKYNSLVFRRNEYKALITINVDEPFAYLGKSVFGDISGFFHDITATKGQASHRLGCLVKEEKDPYEVIDYIISSAKNAGAGTRFFFPVGDHSSYDRNPSWKNDDYRKLIISTTRKTVTGIRTSFKASVNTRELTKEVMRFKAITGNQVISGRFNILKLSMPALKNLSDAGICEDYSMGFRDEPGFRAGIARPFFFYDISAERISKMRLIPFQFLDITFSGSEETDPAPVMQEIRKSIAAVREAGGFFVSIWHNTTLLETVECQVWRDLFEFMLKEQMQ